MLKITFGLIALIHISLTAQVGKQTAIWDTAIVSNLRHTFYSAVEDEDKVDALFSLIKDRFSSNISKYPSIILAYFGAGETLIAKHSYNPFKKVSYLNSGLEKIEKAITKTPDNLEIRFIRFSILHYIPSFLGYSNEREEDLNSIYNLLLKKDYSEVTMSIQNGIKNFLLESGRLTKTQQQALMNLKIAFK
jgi:hypothetical protein